MIISLTNPADPQILSGVYIGDTQPSMGDIAVYGTTVIVSHDAYQDPEGPATLINIADL